ncbi:Syntaxin-8 [Blastocladiella emersonii ATCC 22665]|nr:Syntaxin-8 [Blastocladiella emersonii ATCC 22665]
MNGPTTEPTFALANNAWKSDLVATTALAESTLLQAVDVAHIPGSAAHTSPNVAAFQRNYRTLQARHRAAEAALSRAEEQLLLPADELKVWEDKLVNLATLLESIRDVALDLDESAAAAGSSAGAAGAAAGAPVVPAPRQATLGQQADERAQLLGINPSAPMTRVARVSMAHRRHGESPEPTTLAEAEPQQLMQMQRLMFDEQDAELEALVQVVGRQKNLALAMDEELGTQNEMLDDLTEGVTRTGSQMTRARRRLSSVSKQISERSPWLLILALVILLILILVVL